jgi:hypothetical protein
VQIHHTLICGRGDNSVVRFLLSKGRSRPHSPMKWLVLPFDHRTQPLARKLARELCLGLTLIDQ